jgi:hypothetical protein
MDVLSSIAEWETEGGRNASRTKIDAHTPMLQVKRLEASDCKRVNVKNGATIGAQVIEKIKSGCCRLLQRRGGKVCWGGRKVGGKVEATMGVRSSAREMVAWHCRVINRIYY